MARQEITCKWIDELRDYCDSKRMLPEQTVMIVPADTVVSDVVRQHALSRGIDIKFDPWPPRQSTMEAVYTSHNTQRLSFLRSLWNRFIGKNDSRL